MRLSILAVVVFAAFGLQASAQSNPKLNQQISQSFKGLSKLPPGWEFHEPSAPSRVTFEPDGLRLTIPIGTPGPSPAVGIHLNNIAAAGDFEVTMRYEILKTIRPEDAGNSVNRFTLDVVLSDPHSDSATLSRWISSSSGQRFFAWHRMWDDASGKKREQTKGIPAQAPTGLLRIARAGSEIFYFASDGPTDDFKLVVKYPFRRDDLNTIRFVGTTGGPKAELDVRLAEVQIRAETLPGAPLAVATDLDRPTAATPTPSTSRLALKISIGLAITILVIIGLALVLRAVTRRRADANADRIENE